MAAVRVPLALSLGLAGVAMLAACSSSGSGPSATGKAGGTGTTASSESQPAPAASGRTIRATLTEFHIALSRSSLTPGTYTFDVTNAGHITHALTVDGKQVDDKGTRDLSPGQSATLTVTLRPGTYDVFCPVGDHKMEGMDTKVHVA